VKLNTDLGSKNVAYYWSIYGDHNKKTDPGTLYSPDTSVGWFSPY
jgi:hypothetical protein